MYLREIKTRHGQTRWAVDIGIRGVRREMLFANELAAKDALVIAFSDREAGVPPEQTLRTLRMLAWDTLNFEHELSDAEFERLQAISKEREKRRRGQDHSAVQRLHESLLRLCSRAGLDWQQVQNLTLAQLLQLGRPAPEPPTDGTDA